MTKICIGGATGQVGRATVKELLKRIPASNISLITRNASKLNEETALGMQVYEANYSDKASLEKAFAGCDVVMLTSGAEIGIRIEQHRNVIEVSEKVGVKHIVYTSVSGCHPMNRTPSSIEHIATEAMLHQSSVGFTALRNHFYAEFVKGLCLEGLRTGKFQFPGERGLISPVAIDDIAACAAVIMTEVEKHKNVVYEITGPEMISMQEITQRVATVYETNIEYISCSEEEVYANFEARGIPLKGDPTKKVPFLYGAAELAANYIAIDELFHATLSCDVERITGNKPKKLDEVLIEGKKRWLASLEAKR